MSECKSEKIEEKGKCVITIDSDSADGTETQMVFDPSELKVAGREDNTIECNEKTISEKSEHFNICRHFNLLLYYVIRCQTNAGNFIYYIA